MGEIAITFRKTVFFSYYLYIMRSGYFITFGGSNFCDNKLFMCIFELNSLNFLTGKKFPHPAQHAHS